jgi:hypothetical protein
LARLDEPFIELPKARLAMPDGAQIPDDAVIVGRADELHVFAGAEWYRSSLEDLTKGVRA